MVNNWSINKTIIHVTIQMCNIINRMWYPKRLSQSCCTWSLCLVHLDLLHVGYDWTSHISLVSGQPPNYWDIFLAYFLLNDHDNVCFYHSTFWMLSCHFLISFFSLHTMWPMVALPLHCKEWIYWWHQFLNSLMYTKIKSE